MSNWDKPFDAEETLERAERLRSLTEQSERLMRHARATLVSTPHPNGRIPSYLSGISKSLDKVLEETYAVVKPPPGVPDPLDKWRMPVSPSVLEAFSEYAAKAPPEPTVPGLAHHLERLQTELDKAYEAGKTGRLVVAGDYEEFMHYCNRERIVGPKQVFVNHPDKLIGLAGGTIYLVGNYGAQVEVMEYVHRLPKEDFPLHVALPL